MNIDRSRRLSLLAWIIVAFVIIADQAMKIWVKTSFYLGEDLEIFPWFHLRFIQNNGMAFGIELGSKILLTTFRIALVAFLSWYLVKLTKAAKSPAGYVASIALVIAGAFGNIVDCMFYGEIFSNPYPPFVAEFVPWGEGYGTLMQGLVVDMLYFPLFSFTWPSWVPGVGGSVFSFFDPVFNIADSAITVGMALIICFYSKYLTLPKQDEKAA
ncbi:MAG: lipoprotein signal peptidase [Bacteroidales bacterium]|nr:lipoprotein signal peptidase [Bacteroidales bacterium]